MEASDNGHHIPRTPLQPALSDAEAARDAALGSLAAALALEGAPALGSVRGAVQRQLEDAQRLPDMPGFVDYQPLLGRLHEWIADLEAAQAAVAAAQPAAAAEIAEGAAQLAAADEGADPEGWHRLQWLRQVVWVLLASMICVVSCRVLLHPLAFMQTADVYQLPPPPPPPPPPLSCASCVQPAAAAGAGAPAGRGGACVSRHRRSAAVPARACAAC